MPRSIADIRKDNGGLGNLSDEQIVKGSYPDYQKYYGTEDEYAKAIGYGGAGRGLTMSRISSGIDSYAGQLYGAVGAVAQSAGMDGVADFAERGRKANKDSSDYANAQAKAQGGIDDFRDVRGPMSFGNFIGGQAATAAPPMLAQATGGIIGGLVGGPAGAVAGNLAVSYGNAFSDIVDNQGDQTENQPGGRRADIGAAALLAIPYSLVDGFTGIGRTALKAAKGLSRGARAVEKPIEAGSINFLERGLNNIEGYKGGFARAGYTGLKDGAIEGSGETFQEFMNQGGRMAVDPNASFTGEDAQKRYVDSFVGGGVLGGVIGGAGNRGRRFGIQPASAPSSDVLAATEDAPLGQQGILDERRKARQEMSRPDGLPNVIQVDGMNTATGSNADNAVMDSPATGMARQQAFEQQQRAADARQRAQDIKDNADAFTAARNSRDQRAGQFGVDNTKKNLNNLFGELEDAHDQNVLDDVGAAQALSFLQGGDTQGFNALLKSAKEEQTRQNDTSVQGTVNRTTGVGNKPSAGKKYGSQFEAAASELTGERTNNADGIEGNETALERVQRDSGLLEQKRKEDAAAKATADAAKATADAAVKEKADLKADAVAAGVTTNSPKALALYSQLRDAHREKIISTPQLDEFMAQLKNSKFADVGRGLKGAIVAHAAVQTADAQTAQTNLAALQPKAPDATTTTAAPTPAATQADPAPTASAGSVATAAPASGNNIPATQPKPAPAPAVKKATPAERAAAFIDKSGRKQDDLVKVTRQVKGVSTEVEISALDNFTELYSNPQVYGRYLKATGFDTEGNQVASPMPFAQIAAAEKVSREAVRKQLARFGVDETTINAAVATPDALDARAGTAFEESADSTGIVGVPKESDITATDGEVLPQTPRNEPKGEFGRREGTLAQVAGAGEVRGRAETSAEKLARTQADALIKAGAASPENKSRSTVERARRSAENQKLADERQSAILNHPAADEARVDWNEHKQEGSPRYEELTPAVRTAFVLQHFEQAAETGEKPVPMQNLISKFEGQLQDADYTKTGSNSENQGAATGVAAAKAESTTGRADRAGGDATAVQPTTGGQISSGETGARSAEPAARPTVSVKKRRTVERSEAPDSRGASDAKQLTAELTKFLRVGALGRLVNVVQSVSDLPFPPGVAQSIGINAQTQGFVVDGKAYLIADNIAPGKAKAVFMHEVGSHLGVQEMLTQGEFKRLVSSVLDWAGGKAGPEAQKIARAAMARVESAKTDASQHNTELVAYTIEEAINAGYNPSAAGKEGPIKAWMRSVLQQVKNLLTKMGVNPDKFGVQDLVDLAYGAAQSVNAGGVQEKSASPQFSQAAETPRQAINVSHSAIQSAFKDAWTSAGDLGSSLLKKAAFTSDLVNMAANNGLGTAPAYLKAMNAVQTEKVKLVQEVQSVVEDFNKLTPDERGQGVNSVNIFLRDSTMNKAWGYVPSWKPGVKADPAMKAAYDALSPRAQAVVDRVFKHGDNVRTHLKNAQTETAKREFTAAIAAAEKAGRPEQVAKLKVEQELALKDAGKALEGNWPYAPLGRFGDHVVLAMSERYLQAVKDGNKKLIAELQTDSKHYQVERTDTMRSARVLAESLQTNFPGGHVTSFEKGPDNNLVYGGRDALGALTRLRNLVKDSASDDLKLDGTANAAIDKMLRDLHLTLLSETSARKSGISRANIAGANKDMMRTFSGQGQAMAHYIATLRMGADVQDSLQAMKDQAEERTAGDTQRRAYYNELLKRHVFNLDYKPNKAVEAGMALSSVWTLLTNPAHHLTNGLQTAMVTSPQLAGKHGYGKANSALFKAYHDLGPIIKGRSFKDTDFAKLPEDVRAMAKVLADRGSIGVDQGLELGKFESSADGKTHVFTTVVEKLRGMAEGVEAVNRLSAAIAAYRLEISNGATPQAATDYAHKTVLDTHGDYSGFNAPRVMRNGVGRLLTQFKKYQLLQLSLYAKLGHEAFNGASPEERAVAYKTIAFNLAHLAAMGGMTGLPGFALAAWIMGKMFGDKDKPEDAEAKLRRLIGDKNLADLLLHGAPKFAGIDTSVKLGLGDILTPLPYSEPGLNRKGYESVLLGLSGPLLGGLLPRFADGLGQMSKSIETGKGEDFFKGLEQLVPNGVGNLMKGVRYQANGLTQRNGDTVIQPEDMSVLTSMSQALGLPSNTITDKNYLAGQMRASGEFYKQRSSAIKQAYVNAQESNNADGMRAGREEWMRMQGVLREQGYAVQPLSVLLKAPAEKRKREDSAVSGVETNKRNRGAVDMLTE